MKHHLELNNGSDKLAVEVELQVQDDGTFKYRFSDGRTGIVRAHAISPHELVMQQSEHEHVRYAVERRKGQTHALASVRGSRVGSRYAVARLGAKELAERRKRGAAGAAGEWSIAAPMPGRVTRILVAEGETVKAGQALLVIEAMKMENELRAPESGQVLSLPIAAGTAVEMGAVLVKAGPAPQ